MPRRKPPSVALGALPSTRVEDPLGLEGMDSATPDPMATSSQASLGEVMLEHAPNIVQGNHSPSQPTISKTPDMASISPSPQSWPPRASPTGLTNEVLWLQREMNAALEQLLTTRATLNSHWRELVWNADIGRCQNDTQATKAIKEAEVWCATTIWEEETHCEVTIKEVEAHHVTQAYDLEQSHKGSMLKHGMLKHEVLVEEQGDCQVFVEACGTALLACALKPHGVLMYPL